MSPFVSRKPKTGCEFVSLFAFSLLRVFFVFLVAWGCFHGFRFPRVLRGHAAALVSARAAGLLLQRRGVWHSFRRDGPLGAGHTDGLGGRGGGRPDVRSWNSLDPYQP